MSRPEDRVDQHLAEVGVLEVFGNSEGRVKDATSLVLAHQRDGLRVLAVVSGLKDDNVIQKVGALIEFAADEGADAAKHRMLGLVRFVRDLYRLVRPVALMRSAENLAIEHLVVGFLESVTGGADADASSALDGIFTLTTDATIVSQNQEDGAQTQPNGSKKIVWKANPQTKEAPLAVLQLNPLP